MKAVARFLLRHWPLSLFLIAVVLLTMTTNVLERMFVYFPTKKITTNPSRVGLDYEDVYSTTQDGIKVHGWFVPRRGAHRTFLIFHGNAGNIGHRVEWIQVLHWTDAHVLIIDYRGYGNSEGEPTEKGLYLDALAAYEWWSHEHSKDGGSLILIGESLGGAVAIDLASRVPVDGIVLQSTFTSAWDMSKTLFPLGLLQPLTGIRFDSAKKIKSIHCPKLFIHGDHDEIVPYRLGRKLYDLAPPPKDFYTVPMAGHNDLLWVAGNDYARRLSEFLK